MDSDVSNDPKEKTLPQPNCMPSLDNGSDDSRGRSAKILHTVKHYLTTRLTTLAPPLTRIPNPFHLLRLLNTRQWLFFLVAFLGWTWDSFDFFTVTLILPELAATFDRSKSDITWAITLVLMLRSVGAIVFGIASDRYGRKWPFIVNIFIFMCLEIGMGFVQTFRHFLAIRAIFGVAMGGLYGNAATTGKLASFFSQSRPRAMY